MPRNENEVVIIGSGPAGAASALHLLKVGIEPIIIEKEPFPRYHIGESLTGECANFLRELGLEPQLQATNFPVKRGVKIYGRDAQNSFWVPVKCRADNGSLVDSTTWQVRRSEFDNMLLTAALERGARLVRGEAIGPRTDGASVTGVTYRKPDGSVAELPSKVLIDASGQATFLASRSPLTSGKQAGRYGKQVAVFSQLKQTVRDAGADVNNTLVFTKAKNHWAWFIPLDAEITSVGVVCPATFLKAFKGSAEQFLHQELRSLNPELSRRTPDLRFIEPVRTISNYSYHVHQFTGPGFLCVGDAHRFLDPIFSFGVYFALKEAALAANAIEQAFASNAASVSNPFSAYQDRCERGQDVIQDLIDGFWEFPLIFLIYAHYQYPEAMIDLFAGRIYEPGVDENPVLKGLRTMLARRRENSQ